MLSIKRDLIRNLALGGAHSPHSNLENGDTYDVQQGIVCLDAIILTSCCNTYRQVLHLLGNNTLPNSNARAQKKRHILCSFILMNQETPS